MINIAENAAQKIKDISNSEDIGHYCVRVKVVGGGCAGFGYDLYYDSSKSDLDEQFEDHGVIIIVDPLSLQYMDGMTINYEKRDFAEGFKFINPNVTSSCGCGNSVSF